jgi:hypothetical protein
MSTGLDVFDCDAPAGQAEYKDVDDHGLLEVVDLTAENRNEL